MGEESTRKEEFKVSGDALLKTVKEILHQGNIRRVSIKNEQGKVIIDIPLTFGVVGVLIAPQLAAVGAIAALVTSCTIMIEKVVPEEGGDEQE